MTNSMLFGTSLILGVAICYAERDLHAERTTKLEASGDQFHVGAVSWNLKDDGVAEEANSAILRETLKRAFNNDTELFAFMYQENMKPKETEKWLKSSGLPLVYELVGHNERHSGLKTKGMHGSSGVMLFHKAEGRPTTGSAVFGSGVRHLPKNDEKGMTAVSVNIGGRKFCFASAHLGTDLVSLDRRHKFDKYAIMLSNGGKDCPEDPNCQGCEFAWFGGDFNWRNGGLDAKTDPGGIGRQGAGGKGVHSHFEETLVKEYFKSLDLSGDRAFYQAKRGPLDIPSVLLINDQRKNRELGWLEGPGMNSTELLSYPPTFQPANCPRDGVDTALAGKITKVNKDKDPVCLKTKSGGNCANAICMSAMRPLAFSDAIYHKTTDSSNSISSIIYGPMIMPLASDHFPMVGSWFVKF